MYDLKSLSIDSDIRESESNREEEKNWETESNE